jgi:IS30 family transposase
VTIDKRPDEVAGRKDPGRWEGDRIIGTVGSAIGVLIERATKAKVLLHLPPLGGNRQSRMGRL